MRNKNGFTLTEILVTIAMIAVLGTIIIYSTIGVTNSSKENQYNRMIENIKNSAKTYVSLYPDEFGDLFSSKAFTYIPLSKLISAGLLDEDIVNPYTKEKIDVNQECTSSTITGNDVCLSYIKVYVDGDSLEMNYKYPLVHDDFDKHIWLETSTITVTANDDGKLTPVYAYKGLDDTSTIPTTDFAFVNENGSLINGDLSKSLLQTYQSKFELTYSVPSSFVSCADTTNPATEMCKAPYVPSTMPRGASKADYYVPTEVGTYEIKYNWVYTNEATGVKTNRSDSRKVRIISVSDEEIAKKSSGAKTTKQVVSTTTNENGLIYEWSGSFGASENYKTDTRFLQGNENGEVEPFTLYLEGYINSDTVAGSFFVDMKDDSGSGFDIVYNWTSKNGTNVRTIAIRSFSNGTEYKHVYIQDIKVGKPFRLVIWYEPTASAKKTLNVRYIPDTTSGTAYTYSNLSVPSLQHEGVMYLGGSRKDTYLLNGGINKIAVFKKVDSNLINQSLS